MRELFREAALTEFASRTCRFGPRIHTDDAAVGANHARAERRHRRNGFIDLGPVRFMAASMAACFFAARESVVVQGFG
jgi:hypothetical protein